MTVPKWINSRYQILAPLGTGASSSVHQAIDRGSPDEPLVAIKLLGHLPNLDGELLKSLFAREVKALAKLAHLGIVTLLDFGLDDTTGTLYVVLEYLDQSQTLRRRRETWPPDTLFAIRFVIEILDAVAYAHELDVIHRDLNPSNILVDLNANWKIIDFGISKIMGEISSGFTVGDMFTRPYAAPEQLAYQAIGPQADIYSIAALSYFLLTGKDPESDRSLEEQFKELQKNSGQEFPSDVATVLYKMSSVDPTDRYQSALQARLALERAIRNIQRNADSYYIVLTRNSINQLFSQLAIQSHDANEAKTYMETVLGGEVYLLQVDGSSETYDIIGDGISCRCILEQEPNSHEYDRFIVTSVRSSITPHEFENRRQHGFPVNASWQIGIPGMPRPSNIVSLAGLIDDVYDFFRNRLAERKNRESRKDIVDSWLNLLYLDSELRVESLKYLEYSSWNLIDGNAVFCLEIKLRDEAEQPEDLFEYGQLLTMGSTQNKQVAVGRYLHTTDLKMYIARLPSIDPKSISAAGKVMVDERQWHASWERQRQALFRVIDNTCTNPNLPNILVNPKRSQIRKPTSIETVFNEHLDETKKAAVSSALAAKDLFLIQGPPGTGKTVLISEIVLQILTREPEAKVLLVSQSNVAVDHALSAVNGLVIEHDLPIRTVRVGRESVVSDTNLDHMVATKVEHWAQTIREGSKKYLDTNISRTVVSDVYASELELAKEVRNWIASQNADFTEDVRAGYEMLRESLPDLGIQQNITSLDAAISYMTAARFGKPSELEVTLTEWIERVGRLDDFEEAYLQNCQVVAGTCVGIAGVPGLPPEFDWVIIDEAGRATPSELLIPLVRGRYGILVGDQKQLPPVFEYAVSRQADGRADIDPIWLTQSLFEYLFNHLPTDSRTVLKTQYRMHPHIASLISHNFYPADGLTTGVSADKRTHGWSKWDAAVVWTSTSRLSNKSESGTDSGSRLNFCEVQIIERQLDNLELDLRKKELRKRVGVIAGYAAQIEYLRRNLDPHDPNRWHNLDIEINTVDAFQGRECDIVFYSVVRSNIKREIGFLRDARRLNVALSRARELLFIVGDHRMVGQANTQNSPNPFASVIAYMLENPQQCRLVELES